MDITGQVALVTGGASGLGLATTKALLAQGARVVVLDLGGTPAAEAAAAIEGVTVVAADVRDEAQVSAALDAADALGDLRVVVNCAGVGDAAKVLGKQGPFPLAQFQRVIDINLVGTFNVIRLAVERMARTEPIGEERGVIVSTASVAAFDGQIGQAAYTASKAGVAGMTLPIARELAALRIRVNTIAPGLFDTPLLAALPEPARISLGQQVPHPARLGDPAEFGLLVTQIVANPMLNGETIRLDGAIRMAPR
ncbi:SDR family NAD(P)-dependent oxidoreductase [Agrococcus sediminis]|jgi:NAD(P)-dependent dehydrogenase (short-subunit alcohol dehydrogenase family)|uniref:SDR family NAD(P)-dependent oxidoreductase n=1 Tax=Agrococcus sediminis TaxID=2599924 RepID=A0A5M8QLX0_9MICO|nr:SDR family NAD(P)-dependent oxidoreductase [Agrococcus sediminis]KAA6435222.1 SDR family NAD(P)-dependent oxidoreductase [Agrococcus sediminis]RWR25036.1 SDR family NAD(P)-dependent oxidoreductase [Agrococcus lahaulensis]